MTWGHEVVIHLGRARRGWPCGAKTAPERLYQNLPKNENPGPFSILRMTLSAIPVSEPAIPVAVPVGPADSVFYWAAKAIEDVNSAKAAALYWKAVAHKCPHSLYALGTMYAKYPPPTSTVFTAYGNIEHRSGCLDSHPNHLDRLNDPNSAGRIEIKKAAKMGYAPALYRMHWCYKSVVADSRLDYGHSNHTALMVGNHIRGKAFQKSESYLREAKACDPDGSALMFDIDRFKWGRAFPAIEIREYWPEALSERYQMAIKIAQDLPDKVLVHERISAYLDTLNEYVDTIKRQGKLIDEKLEERCRIYYMLGMACKDLGMVTEAQKNFGLAAAVTLPSRLGSPWPQAAEHRLAELTRM